LPKSDLRPGDHIFTPRLNLKYYHQGIYVGHGMVIHFVPVWPFKDNTEFPNPGPCEKCQGFNGGHHIIGVYGKVVRSCVGCFGNQIYLYRYGVSWEEAFLKPGTCCPYQSKPLDEAVKTAKEKLNSTGFGGYDPKTNNSEHFATFCRTGKKYSLIPIIEKFG
ncbi:LRAT domain-containing protein, partial [Cephalotus follicularis]